MAPAASARWVTTMSPSTLMSVADCSSAATTRASSGEPLGEELRALVPGADRLDLEQQPVDHVAVEHRHQLHLHHLAAPRLRASRREHQLTGPPPAVAHLRGHLGEAASALARRPRRSRSPLRRGSAPALEEVEGRHVVAEHAAVQVERDHRARAAPGTTGPPTARGQPHPVPLRSCAGLSPGPALSAQIEPPGHQTTSRGAVQRNWLAGSRSVREPPQSQAVAHHAHRAERPSRHRPPWARADRTAARGSARRCRRRPRTGCSDGARGCAGRGGRRPPPRAGRRGRG